MSTEPVGLTRDLAPLGVMRAQIGQNDIAVWRSTSGIVSAWENRCPHRGMRLSHGFVRGESLACAYHGWHYDCAGTCHYIPAHPTLVPPKTITPTIFSVAEHAGIVWVNTTSDAIAPSLPADIVGVRSLTINCNLDTAIEAFKYNMKSDKSLSVESINQFSQSPVILSLTTSNYADAVFILFQQPEQQRIVSHVLAKDSFSTNKLITLSRWCESVRRYAEAIQPAPNAKSDKP